MYLSQSVKVCPRRKSGNFVSVVTGRLRYSPETYNAEHSLRLIRLLDSDPVKQCGIVERLGTTDRHPWSGEVITPATFARRYIHQTATSFEYNIHSRSSPCYPCYPLSYRNPPRRYAKSPSLSAAFFAFRSFSILNDNFTGLAPSVSKMASMSSNDNLLVSGKRKYATTS